MFDVDQCIKNVKGLGWLGTAPHYGENLSEMRRVVRRWGIVLAATDG
jgi:hypothetical protein